jgi:flagellar hook-basal body complex protein FliE
MKKSIIKKINKGQKKKGLPLFKESVNEGKFGKFDTGAAFKGNGLTIYDRNQSQGGDYKNIAHISEDGKITIWDKNIKKEHKLMQALKKISNGFKASFKESINERRGISIGEEGMYFFIDQLINSMEHYDEREFVRELGKKLEIDKKVMGRIWKNYLKVHPPLRYKWTPRHWERWLNKQGITEDTKRDYKAEYKKFQSSTKAKKYRAELNQYNRKKGTYGNNDGKDASHKGGKIVGFENQSVNRGRREKSRLKKEFVSVNEAVEPQGNMAKIAKIVSRKQATKLGGVMIDMQSASLLMKLWDAVSDKDKEKMNKLNPKVLTTVIKKLWSRVNLKLPM